MASKRTKTNSPANSLTYTESLLGGLRVAAVSTSKGELLQKYGLSDRYEIEAVDAHMYNALKYGCDAQKKGISNLFTGMEQAVVIYTELKSEIHTLHQGILMMRKEVSETRDQLLLAETTASHKMEVCYHLQAFHCRE